MGDFNFILLTSVDAKFYNFLKAMANSIRINSPNLKLIVRTVGFRPSVEAFRKNHYEHTDFVFDDSPFPSASQKFEFDSNSESKIKDSDEISIYTNNINIHCVDDMLKEDGPMIAQIDADTIIRKDLSVVKFMHMENVDMGVLKAYPPPELTKLYEGRKYYQFGFVPVKRNDRARKFFQEFRRRLKLNQPKNEPLFNEVIYDFKNDLSLFEFDERTISGPGNVFYDEAIMWHANGVNKFWDLKFRKEFYFYLGANHG